MTEREIYLASASPRRHEILNQMGIQHRILIVPPPPGEDEPRLAGESPKQYVMRTASEKSDRALAWMKHQ
ncbi:MAG: septum formation inhibitor Maf, partial [Alcaligenaceae bacterium]|nr:septum formation inhibitor Maf [Alcaligenaceae bacterium]